MNKINKISHSLLTVIVVSSFVGCTREINTDVLATSPVMSEVFIDAFASDLQYQAWGKPTNLSLDSETKYSGSASLKIAVPDPTDFLGNWAGGTFYTEAGRDLSGYDALTFYAKSSIPTTVEVGLGSYGDNPEFSVSLSGVKVDENWNKIIIPIPNSAKLTSEKGMFYYSAGAVDGAGYSVWFDEVKFEHLGTLAHTRIENMTMAGFPSGDIEIETLTCYVNLPTGVFQKMTVSSKYFTFDSSNPDVATVEGNVITFHGAKDRTVLTPREAEGSITISGVYDFAPVPDKNESDVISLYCDSYTNTLSSPFNGYWAPYQTTTNNEIALDETQHIMHYGNFNFVGIVLDEDAETIGKTYVHLDILLQDKVDNAQIDISADRSAEAGDVAGKMTVTLVSGEWVSIDIPLNGAEVIHQLQLSVTSGSIAYKDILVDNIYFY